MTRIIMNNEILYKRLKLFYCSYNQSLIRYFLHKSFFASMSSPIALRQMSNGLSNSSIRKQHSDSSLNLCDENQNYEFTYKEAITALNGLQSNAQNIKEAIVKERGSNSSQSLVKTRYFLSLLNISDDDLNSLNVIHVSGTKGKGSTCAFADSILRRCGYKTGFYSSPHLVAARERIRINGEPLSENKFALYFWSVYNQINQTKDDDSGMPAYFNFLTLMAFKVFLEEKVDATILEVGIGGEYDCTNVVPKPIVTGVSSLGFDHCKLLGDTIEKIAWQKAGIFKESVCAFTVHQTPAAMRVLRSRANEKKCSLHVCPPLSLYHQRTPIQLGIKGEVQKLNASLALQLTYAWRNRMQDVKYLVPSLITNDGTVADVFPINKSYLDGLSMCWWPGRCQMIRKDNIIYFLDGAHTDESMSHCAQWFKEQSQKLMTFKKLCRILIFNCTGERLPETLLTKLDIKFDVAIFCPNRVAHQKDVSSDQSNFTVTPEREMEVVSKNAEAWLSLNEKANVIKLPTISDAIKYITLYEKDKPSPIHVLVAGSVHLVGGVLGIIDPQLVSPQSFA